jgi:N-acetylated-alpha-linked acidic dipeptidase
LLEVVGPVAQTMPWDARFRNIPSSKNIGEYMRRLSARPHHLGSPYDRDNAEWIRSQLQSWGWDAQIESFDVLFPTPRERIVELVAPMTYRAVLQEPPVNGDPTSSQQAEQLPGFNAYSIDGDVTAPLVYVNYGRPEDYAELDRRGISVKGAIVIARYGGAWRGIKPKVAAEHGAVGCLIYSDPRDDGYFVGDVFPAGPMKNANGVQRGSVMDLPTRPGDPLTPGVAATADARRLARADAETLTKIPVLPISYGDAQPLLAALRGQTAPESWRGALPFTYHIGPGPARVHLKLAFNWETKRLYDVVARITGSRFPDEWVLRGNHHDAWVNGAGDPSSGMAAELEEARAIGQLVKSGWRPQRTIVYLAWDAEEQGLIGSTEWVEAHERELQDKAVAYLNSDNNGRGFLNVSGSHSLEAFVNEVARDVEDPETNLSLWKRLQAQRIVSTTGAARTEARTRRDLRIGALGSGSDYTPFLQHSGIASLDLRFSGLDNGDGVYHSAYDDYYHFTRFLDTDFTYGRVLAQTVGTMVIRLADAPLLPFDFSDAAETVQTYVEEVEKLLKDRQAAVREQNQLIEEGVFAALADRRRGLELPRIEPTPPALDFSPLEMASAAFARAADRYRRAASAVAAPLAADTAQTINARLRHAEAQLIDPAGLPRRPWYRHLLYAPGYYTGYAVKTLPGVREAIEEKAWSEAAPEAARIAAALEREARLVDEAAALLEQLPQGR